MTAAPSPPTPNRLASAARPRTARARPRRGALPVSIPVACAVVALGLARRGAAEAPRAEPARRAAEHERVRQTASAACAAAMPQVDARDDAARRARARWAPALPTLSVRAHVGDGGFRRLDGDTLVTGETLTASRSVEVRLAWSLDELAYRAEELALARFEVERRAQADRQRQQCGELAAKWVRARLDPEREEADELAAFTALDVATGGALSREEAGRRPPARERSP